MQEEWIVVRMLQILENDIHKIKPYHVASRAKPISIMMPPLWQLGARLLHAVITRRRVETKKLTNASTTQVSDRPSSVC